jgi:hypothetical protein
MRHIIIAAACGLAASVALTAAAGATTRHHPHRYVIYPSHPYYQSRPGLADPSFMPNPQLQFLRRNGDCVIDEGYGRVTRCN